jgi:hypothetical protein
VVDWCRLRFSKRILLTMTAWIVLFALTVMFALALRPAHPKEPPLPPGHDGERQLAELRAMAIAGANTRFP